MRERVEVETRRDSEAEPNRFARVEQPRAHEYVAEQIRRQIVLRLIPTGQALPPERDLASIFGVGRATVQQAIRMLVDARMVESRRGRHGGGNFVVGPDEDRAGMTALLERVRRSRPEIEEALAYRRAVEPASTQLAARARSEAHLRSLRAADAAAGAAESDGEFMQADTEFHLALADATGNRFFREAIERTRLELNDVMIALPESPLWHERSLVEHGAILAAVEARDPRAAGTAMTTHIGHTERSIEALLGVLVDSPLQSG